MEKVFNAYEKTGDNPVIFIMYIHKTYLLFDISTCGLSDQL
jgi:hypothetical protein